MIRSLHPKRTTAAVIATLPPVHMPSLPLPASSRPLLGLIGSWLNEIMNFIPFSARRNEPGENHADHAFFDRNCVTDFELRFVGAPSEGPRTLLFVRV